MEQNIDEIMIKYNKLTTFRKEYRMQQTQMSALLAANKSIDIIARSDVYCIPGN